MSRLLADLLVVVHLLWILFMLAGIGINLIALFGYHKFLAWFWFRTLHLAGIALTCAFGLFGQLCPLTVWENVLRLKSDPSLAHSGSFIISYLEKIIYLSISPKFLFWGTILAGVFSLVGYLWKPPRKGKKRRVESAGFFQ